MDYQNLGASWGQTLWSAQWFHPLAIHRTTRITQTTATTRQCHAKPTPFCGVFSSSPHASSGKSSPSYIRASLFHPDRSSAPQVGQALALGGTSSSHAGHTFGVLMTKYYDWARLPQLVQKGAVPRDTMLGCHLRTRTSEIPRIRRYPRAACYT